MLSHHKSDQVMNNLPVASPAEHIKISPEALEVANTYLSCQSIQKVSQELCLSPEEVSDYLNRREVKAYIDNVFFDVGFNNKFTMRKLMDTIIQKKLEELDEAEIGSSKDIADLLALSHKMTMELMDKQIKLEQLKQQNAPKTQVNMQINELGDGTKYGSLIERLMKS